MGVGRGKAEPGSWAGRRARGWVAWTAACDVTLGFRALGQWKQDSGVYIKA